MERRELNLLAKMNAKIALERRDVHLLGLAGPPFQGAAAV